jgi:hypothetical protein
MNNKVLKIFKKALIRASTLPIAVISYAAESSETYFFSIKNDTNEIIKASWYSFDVNDYCNNTYKITLLQAITGEHIDY